MLKLSCLCGQLRVQIEAKPAFINECNCLLCSKTGARWGYFHPSQVTVDGRALSYCREDKDDPAARIHFCRTCGSTTHFTLTDSAVAKFGNAQMGVNMRLVDDSELAGIELRYPDGRNWPGAGSSFGYVQDARIIGA